MHHGQDHHVKIHQLLTPTPAGPCSFHCLWIFPLFGGKKILDVEGSLFGL